MDYLTPKFISLMFKKKYLAKSTHQRGNAKYISGSMQAWLGVRKCIASQSESEYCEIGASAKKEMHA